MWALQPGRRYRLVDCGGTQYWGTVEQTNHVGVRLSGVLFCLKGKEWQIHHGRDALAEELEWRFVGEVWELYQ